MNRHDQEVYNKVKEIREQEKQMEQRIAEIDKKVLAIAEGFGDTIEKDKDHVMAIALNHLNEERKALADKKNQTQIEANDLENQTISREAAKETLTTFTQIYRPLSPYDKKRLVYQLIHSITYTKDTISIRYYIIPQLDILINEKGVTMTPTAGAGFATPTSWRPLDDGKSILIDAYNIVTYRAKDWKIKLRFA